MPSLSTFSRTLSRDQSKPRATDSFLEIDDDAERSGRSVSLTDGVLSSDDPHIPTSTRFSRLVNDSWLLEISSLTLSIAAVTAAALLLHGYNGRPLQDWKHNFSINAVLSFVAIISKATMILVMGSALSQDKWNLYANGKESRPLLDFQIFDSASRGPMGSLRLTFQRKSSNSLMFIQV